MRTSNPFFGVGPISDGASDEIESRLLRIEFESWLEANYRKFDDRGEDIGHFTVAEIGRSMHRGYPADKVLHDMMREIHRYFEFPKANRMAVGLGGGHSAFTVCAMHMINANDPTQHVFVDTPEPETEKAISGGFFRQSWGAQLVEMQKYARNGDVSRVHFSSGEGAIAASRTLRDMGVKLVIGVGHETTGATTYTRSDITNLLEWLDSSPDEHHAALDATSMLGAMPWPDDLVKAVMAKCCLFMPLQKAIGGVSGYFVASFTPHALALIEANQKAPSWAIPRQLKLAAPVDTKRPLSGERTVELGPFYDPATDKMLGGVINTFSILAFAETTFGLLRSEGRIGPVRELNRRSVSNRAEVDKWVTQNPLFSLGVSDSERRGAAVTLLKINDPDIADPALLNRIVARSKQLLAYEGITHPNRHHECGMDVARYINAFPGTPGEYRAWIGGIRPLEDVNALLENLKYAYHRARIVVLEEELEKLGCLFAQPSDTTDIPPVDGPPLAYKVLIADHVGLRINLEGKPDYAVVKTYIEAMGGIFHDGPVSSGLNYETGKIHFFYQPDLSTELDILSQTDKGQYDAVIAAATVIPRKAIFRLGGVRIGAGTGNMGSASWGEVDGKGGEAPLMNTPGFNSRATAQMVIKTLLKRIPDLPVDELHRRVVAQDFDTGRNLREFPTEKLERKKIAVIGYGNIGREVAKLAMAFGMQVSVYARESHREWIDSEGFQFAETVELAAAEADVISLHIGLGLQGDVPGKYANSALIGESIFNSLHSNALVINFDRGELIDLASLDKALACGKVGYAAIDADVFMDKETCKLSGPLAPYLDLATKYPGKLELLPHAAADTDHWSRVDGAMQAVNQIFGCILYKRVTNLKGDLPAGFSNAGIKTAEGVGSVTPSRIAHACTVPENLRKARECAARLSAFWGAVSATGNPSLRAALIERHGASLIMHNNQYTRLMRELGLGGEFKA
ncbi:MAG: hypothetical protein K8F25_12345 [Fimbriimonadaceae bacterium]|nr:hypothetical protein [Alphaproteobacteria bacterium]